MTDHKPGGVAAASQTLQCIYTERAPKPFGDAYCQAIVAGGFVFVSGQGGFLPDGTLVGDGAEEQAAQMIKNIQAILEQAGAGHSMIIIDCS